MEVEDQQSKTPDISSLKETAKEIMEKSESNGDNKVNGVVNGDANGSNGDKHDNNDEEMETEEAEVEAPVADTENGDDNEENDVETIGDSPVKNDESPRRSSRQKSPSKYQDILEAEKDESSEEEIEEVEEIKDDDSDIQEVDADDDGPGTGVTITPKNGAKKPNVVTIDDLKTLQKLATTAKNSLDKEKSDKASVIDTQSLIAGKMGSGVSITPAKPKTPVSAVNNSGGLAISPAGMTLGSGVTIRPNKPVTSGNSAGGVTNSNSGVSITPVDKSGSSSSNTSTSSNSSNSVDPGLTDDTYVVEAPSFIVPYVYEKPPKENIKDFKESIDKLIDEKQKEKERRKAAGEEVSDDEQKDDDSSEDEDEKKEKKEKEEKEKEKKKEDVGKDSYFNSTLGKYFIDLGMNLVQEFVQKDLLREQQRRSVKDKSVAVIHAIKSLEANLEESKDKNEGFHHDLRKCKFCSFRTESRLVLQHHMETPHMRNFVYRCNFCDFETKIPQEVLFHMDSEHGIKGKLERAPYYHQCSQCPFEDNAKGKLTRHKVGCDKRFKTEENQKPERDWDPPAKIRPPPVRPGNYAQGFNYKQGQAGQVRQPGSSLMPRTGQNFQSKFQNNMANRGMGGQKPLGIKGMTPQMLASQQMLAVLNQQGLSVSGGMKGINNLMMGGGQKSGSVTIQSLGQKNSPKGGGSPSISITPLPGRNNPGAKKPGASNAAGVKPGQPGQGQGKGNFVICEICDGYIKDLEQLRNHMQYIHKVKIHPKMIYNRPPLNCQKCQCRFFTDSGLERHLLGSHGLVTASMQDAANKGQDSGRCPVCGKVYQWKLLNHVAKDHGKTLKPAHLSYKCTVCTATFGQYKLFENHVYTAHSGVAKKGDKNKQAQSKPGGGSVLKAPVKLSDEISIIPTKKDKQQDKSKEVIDLDDEEEIDDVEKEVIDIDTPKKRSTEALEGQPEAKRVKADGD